MDSLHGIQRLPLRKIKAGYLENPKTMKIEWGSKYEPPPPIEQPIKNWALNELAEELKRSKINININLLCAPDAFDDGGWCIHEEDGVWLVYHSERGHRSRPAIFTSSFDAANYYMWIHICSPTADNSSVGRLPRIR